MRTYVTRLAFVTGAFILLALPFHGGAESQSSYPIAPQFQAVYTSSGGTLIFGNPTGDFSSAGALTVQPFEHALFEYHPLLEGTAYAVQLARLGADAADSQGLMNTAAFQPVPASRSDTTCTYFRVTGHQICGDFRDFWQTHGLEMGDQGASTRESIALFGYPLSEQYVDSATGLTVQYFERARLEYHPEFEGTAQSTITLGSLADTQPEQSSSASGPKRRRQSTPTPQPTTSPSPSPTSAATATASPTPTVKSTPSAPTTSAAISIQSLVDAAAPGATVIVPAGIYRETVTIAKPITLVGEPGAEIRGSDDWSSGWNKIGFFWVRGTVPSFGNGSWPCANGLQCDWPEQVFVDGQPLTQVAGSPGKGQFSVNAARQIVLADNPAGHLVEVTTRQYWIVGRAAGVTVRGLTMRHAATPAQQGAINNGGYGNWTISNNILSDAHGAVVSFQGASGLKLLNNDISRGGQEGVTVDATDGTIVTGNVIHDNNTEQFSQAWEAGGLKATHASGAVVDQNVVYANDGAGIWFDMNSRNTTISNNQVHDNSRAGISYEISTTGHIQGNQIWENAWGSPDTWSSSGILLDDADNTDVSGNIVAWNVKGITVIAQNRSDRIRIIANVYVHDNTIAETEEYSPNARYALRWIDDGIAMLYNPSNNNHGDSNRYWYPGSESGNNRFEWSSATSRLSDFEATPGEHNGMYLPDSAKDSTLASVGVPTSPESR